MRWGMPRLLAAELVARGPEGFVQNAIEMPRITTSVRLPAFHRSVHEPYAWPRSRSALEGVLTRGTPVESNNST